MTPSRPPTAHAGRPGNFRGWPAISPPPAEIRGRGLYARARGHAPAGTRMVAAISKQGSQGAGVSERGVSIMLRGSDGRLLPLGPARRAQQIHDVARDRWRAARTPLQKLAVAFDYARSAMSAALRGGLDPSGDIDRATQLLWSIGDALTARLTGSGGDDG